MSRILTFNCHEAYVHLLGKLGFELDIVGRIDSSWADHSAIAEAILAGSGSTAGRLMGEHIVKDERLYLEAVERAGVPARG